MRYYTNTIALVEIEVFSSESQALPGVCLVLTYHFRRVRQCIRHYAHSGLLKTQTQEYKNAHQNPVEISVSELVVVSLNRKQVKPHEIQ